MTVKQSLSMSDVVKAQEKEKGQRIVIPDLTWFKPLDDYSSVRGRRLLYNDDDDKIMRVLPCVNLFPFAE